MLKRPLPLSDAQRKRGVTLLAAAVAFMGFAMALQMGLNANFLADDIGAEGFQVGALEAARESCGIVAVGLLALLAGLTEPLVAALVLAVFSVGIAGYAFVPSYGWVVLASLVWSQGLHIWMPLPHSMALGLAKPGRAGHRLGQIGAAGSLGFAGGLAMAWGLSRLGVQIRPMYILAAAAGVLAAVACLGIPKNIKTPGPRLVFRRKYGLYYLLCFLEGWRKQIFIAFAGFLLVKHYRTPVTTILLLQLAVQVIGFFSQPRVGRLIDRLGERRILVLYYSCLTLFFAGYAVIRNVHLLYALYVIDSAFFVFGMALTTYVNRIAPPSEHTATLSMGVTMNHVAAVLMPLTGGVLWKYFGYQWTFFIGSAAAALSVLGAVRVRAHPQAPTAG